MFYIPGLFSINHTKYWDLHINPKNDMDLGCDHDVNNIGQ